MFVGLGEVQVLTGKLCLPIYRQWKGRGVAVVMGTEMED
jgi:hypothetical protein